jgi:hypothetical protein
VTHVALTLIALSLGAGHKAKPAKPKAPKQLEATLLGVSAAEPTADLLKAFPRIHKHPGERATSWDACDSKESVRYQFYAEQFLAGRVTTVAATKVDPTLCSHDGKPLPELKAKAVTPRGIKLGASEDDIKKAYGAPAETNDTDVFRTLSYKRPLEVKGVEQAIRVVLNFELRAGKLTGMRLVVEPGS